MIIRLLWREGISLSETEMEMKRLCLFLSAWIKTFPPLWVRLTRWPLCRPSTPTCQRVICMRQSHQPIKGSSRLVDSRLFHSSKRYLPIHSPRLNTTRFKGSQHLLTQEDSTKLSCLAPILSKLVNTSKTWFEWCKTKPTMQVLPTSLNQS